MALKLTYIVLILLVGFISYAKSSECVVFNYDTDKEERCEDQNLTSNPKWKEFY